MKLTDVHQRGTRANQPAATAVAKATQYFVTDESVLEQSSGTAWEDISSGAGASDWDSIVIKPSDQDVVNSATLVDDTALQLAVLANEAWYIELFILYSATDAGRDLKWDVAVSAGTMQLVGNYVAMSSTDTIATQTFFALATADSDDEVIGTLAAHGIRLIKAMMTVVFSANGTFTFRFAENAAAVSTEARVKAGSILRAQKIV